MKILVQRSKNSSVEIDSKINGKIDKGLVVFVGFTSTDNEFVVDKMIQKLIHLRIFGDASGLMNLSLLDTKGSILSISQFTLYADTSKGRRPSFVNAMNQTDASKLYDYFNNKLISENIHTETGIFGANMKVNITNDGPVTIMLDSSELL